MSISSRAEEQTRTPPPASEAPGSDKRSRQSDAEKPRSGGSDGEGAARDRKRDDDGGRRRRSVLIRTIFVIAVIVAVIAGATYWFLNRNLETTDDAYTDGRAIAIAPRVSGYVVELDVNDNQFVHRGDVLIRIDPRDYQAARDQAAGALAAAQGQLAGAEAALAKARIVYPAALAAAQGQVQIAEGEQFKAQTDYRRQHSLGAATSQQAVDASTAASQQAQGQLAQAQAQVQQATPVQENIDEAKAQRDQLEGQVKQAAAQLAQAELNLGYTVIRAPQDGWVTRRNVEVGDYAQPGATILSLVSPDVWVTANFKETQLDRIRPGERVDIGVDAFPSLKLEGHVDSMQLGSGSRFSSFPAENATGNFVKIVQRVPVKILIDSGLDPKVPLPLGISVEPTVHLDDTRPAGK
ncbi:MAG TPA: HlyD family secretion protein [Stellaceae bacterium]|nr:HlyD family secretion protein [Stellaceae bacterium]